MKVVHFATAAAFRRWLEKNHAAATELQVGFYKKTSGKGGLTYAEAVDEALCFGWIDGIVRRIDADRYTHRFTPRRPGSIWSNLNVRHVQRLRAAGRMHPAGLAAFEARTPDRTGVYVYEQAKRSQTPDRLPPKFARPLRAHVAAWKYWQSTPPSYRRLVINWILGARQDATRERRLARLLAHCVAGRRLN